MATDLEELRDSFNIETFNEVEAGDVILYLAAGVDIYNALAAQSFERELTLLDRDVTGSERRALVLCATKAYLRGRLFQASRNAIVESNAAGRTDLRSLAKELAARLKELDGELGKIIGKNAINDIVEEVYVHELGETLRVIDGGTFVP